MPISKIPLMKPPARVAFLVALLLHTQGVAVALDPERLQAMVIVEGDEGRGSGFLAIMDGRTYVVTNAHVVQGSKKVSFKTLDNRELKIGDLEIAASADLVRAVVEEAGPALEVAEQWQESVRIGDLVVVAGNAEGAGVVREIEGKVVGIGPDRIEVDAAFVPGNSGSPILLKSSGAVVGVATFLKLPPYSDWFGREEADEKEKPVFHLNEVRRFGYRLDTVGEWSAPPAPGGLLAEGRRLAEIEAFDDTVFELLQTGTERLLEHGGTAYIESEGRIDERFSALTAATNDYLSAYRAAAMPKDREKPTEVYFDRLRELTSLNPPDQLKEPFSGYFSILYRERFEWREGLHEWLDYVRDRASKADWVLESPEWNWVDPKRDDYSKLDLPLEHQIDSSAELDRRHRIVCLESSAPSTYRNLYWHIQYPVGKPNIVKMGYPSLRIMTQFNGKYSVRIEHRVGETHHPVSKLVEFTVRDMAAPHTVVDFSKAPPLPLDADAGDTIDWGDLKSRISTGSMALSPWAGSLASTRTIRDIPGEGGILVGFELFLNPNGTDKETVSALRPVYRKEVGQKDGAYYGNSRVESSFRLVANPGYAIGRLSVRLDGTAVRGLKVRFDRIRGLGLDPKDGYETDWIGQGGEAEPVDIETNGRLPVGLYGRHGSGIEGIGLVCLTDAATAVAPAEAPRIPEVFTSADEILNVIPAHLVELVKQPETRKEAFEKINAYLAEHAKGKVFDGEVRVEVAMPVADRSPNKFRIKVPDTRIHAEDPIRTRLWVYFLADDVPETPPPVGSKVRVRGMIGRCDVNGDRVPLLNNDIQHSQVIPADGANGNQGSVK
jgi:hypothetical protein